MVLDLICNNFVLEMELVYTFPLSLLTSGDFLESNTLGENHMWECDEMSRRINVWNCIKYYKEMFEKSVSALFLRYSQILLCARETFG